MGENRELLIKNNFSAEDLSSLGVAGGKISTMKYVAQHNSTTLSLHIGNGWVYFLTCQLA